MKTSISTNNGHCPGCGKLLMGVAGLCYVTVEDYAADKDERGPYMPVKVNNGGRVPIPCCFLCGNEMKGKMKDEITS